MNQHPKPRKHRFVSQCLAEGHTILRVWPSEDELSSETKLNKYQESVLKISADPRVVDTSPDPTNDKGFVFTIRAEND